MITYSQLTNKLSNEVATIKEDLSKILIDLSDNVILANTLLQKTLNSEAYQYACKIVNTFFFEFLLDKNHLMMHNFVDGRKTEPKLRQLLLANEIEKSERDILLQTYNLLCKTINNVVVMSENDESFSKERQDENNELISDLQRLVSIL